MLTLDDRVQRLSNLTPTNSALVTRAYNLAAQAHAGQTRKSGEPYITHPVAVAEILAAMKMEPAVIAAALLHDTIEDTAVTAEQIREQFGDEVLFLVDAVTKLSSVRYYGTDRHNESLRKLFVATSRDIRVLIIKLADRLHNMQTLDHVDQQKRIRIARETLEIYAPIAHRLGMGVMRKELEDLAFPYVYPEEYAQVIERIDNQDKIETTLERERKTLQKRLFERNVKDFHTTFRVKGLYSFYQKLQRYEGEAERIYDVLAIRVIVPTLEQCYQTLGIVHELWRPLPGRVKDYIAFPKPNGYQSLHTTVTTSHNTMLEVQIRTKQMHYAAEYGIASHLVYKETETGGGVEPGRGWFNRLIPALFRPHWWQKAPAKTADALVKQGSHQEKMPQWIKEIGDLYAQESVSGSEFIHDLCNDFFCHRIFVFTPTGDVVDLPTGATPIDFAYAIHSEIGDHIASVKVNQKMVQLSQSLKNGDTVEIITKPNAKPSPKWLDVVQTTLARRQIRSALAAQQKTR